VCKGNGGCAGVPREDTQWVGTGIEDGGMILRSSMTPLTLGISTCPNDTFAFHGILVGAVSLRGLDLEIELLDVQELNHRLARGSLDLSKASFYAAMHLSHSYTVLPVGAALGSGVGPILVARKQCHIDLEMARVLCPGSWTTAALLFQAAHPEVPYIEHRIFSEIVPAVQSGEVDMGVLIHEGRFTYDQDGLDLVEDLGATWETAMKMPLPLGGLVARRSLPSDQIELFVEVVRESIAYGYSHRADALLTMQRHAQELQPEVLWQHVDLYVNEYTTNLGDVGEKALSALQLSAHRVGLIDPETSPMTVFNASIR